MNSQQGNGSDVPQYQMCNRVAGGFTFLLGFIWIILGAVVYSSMENVRLGAWWGAILVVIPGILSSIAINRCVIIASICFSIIGLIVAAIGTTVDSLAAGHFLSLAVCGLRSDPNGDVEVFVNDAYSESKLGAEITEVNSCVNKIDVCFCLVEDTDNCLQYYLTETNDCGTIFDDYAPLLEGTAIMGAICTVVLLGLSILNCASVCCKNPNGHVAVNTQPPAPEVVFVSQNQNYQTGVVQPHAVQLTSPTVQATTVQYPK